MPRRTPAHVSQETREERMRLVDRILAWERELQRKRNEAEMKLDELAEPTEEDLSNLPDAEGLFHCFRDMFVEAATAPVEKNPSELALSYAIRSVSNDRFFSGTTEWTSLLKQFLSRLGFSLGLVQAWECNVNDAHGIDLGWFVPGTDVPCTALELENDWRKRRIKDKWDGIEHSEVPKLKRAETPLSVLITYTLSEGEVEDREVERISTAAAKAWRDPATGLPRDGFLLIIGSRNLQDPRAWIGFRWASDSTEGGDLVRIDPPRSARFGCSRCHKSRVLWYDGQTACPRFSCAGLPASS